MIERLSGERPQDHRLAAVGRRITHDVQEHRLAHVIAAACREQQPARRQQPHRPQVQLLVAALRTLNRSAVLCQSRRIERDHVVPLAACHRLAKETERVGFHAVEVRDAVSRGIRPRPIQREGGRVHRRHRLGAPRQVQGKAAVIAEDVERTAARVAAQQHAVLALVEERARLLPGPRRRKVSHAVLVHLDLFRHAPGQELDVPGKSLARAHRGVVARQDALAPHEFLQDVHDQLALGFQGRGEQLHHEPAVVLVHHQRRQPVSLTVHQPARIRHAGEWRTSRDGVRQPAAPPRAVYCHVRVTLDAPQDNLRGRTPPRPPEWLASRIGDAHGARGFGWSLRQVAAKDPRVPGGQALGSAGGDDRDRRWHDGSYRPRAAFGTHGTT